MNQTENNAPNSTEASPAPSAPEVPSQVAPPEPAASAAPVEEQIRKIYVKDLKTGESIHTVFKCLKKERHATRSGKPFLAVSLCDRTGEVDARVFENVDAAEMLFAIGDYLLVQGKVGTFHGKTQIVIDRLEHLDPEPIDAAEFAYVAPPKPPEAEKAEKEERPAREVAPREPRVREARDEGELEISHKAARQRLLRLLDNPQLVLAVDAVIRHLESYVDERIAAKLGQPVVSTPRPEKRGRGPRVEHRPQPGAEEAPRSPGPRPEKHELKRDPSLPEGLSFKPLDALVGPTPAPKPSQS